MWPSKRHVRTLFALLVALSAGAVVGSYATAETNVANAHASPAGPAGSGLAGPTVRSTPDAANGTSGPATDGASTGSSRAVEFARGGDGEAAPAQRRIDSAAINESWSTPGNLTVVATQGFYVSDERAELVAYSGSGEVVFYDGRYRVYFDVDPVEGERYTVEYVAARHLEGDDCREAARCTYNVYNRLNLSTGEERTVYGEVTPQIFSGRWHDVDRINDTHVAVADIVRDSVRVVNVTSDETVWSWNASDHFDPEAGGNDGDWTHVNDVEVLDDGRFMVSVRNMDRVVFVDPGEGVDENWTLGAEDDYDVLYEQHNPDYIPAERGGPAITVADSENGRVLEYQRVDPETGEPATGSDGEWRRAWGWRDSRLQWPRDADRLPWDATLVVDTHGDRVVEVGPNGDVDWSVTVGMPYDAERLGTGDESAGGRSLSRISRTRDDVNASLASDAPLVRADRGPVETFWVTLKDLTPSLVANGFLYAAPSWMRFTDLAFLTVFFLSAVGWASTELHWSRYRPLDALRSIRARARRG